MTMPGDPRAIVFSSRVYRALLTLYPRRFRHAYQDEIALLFRDCSREAWRSRGMGGLLRMWGQALLDLGLNLLHERLLRFSTRQQRVMGHTRSCSGCYSEIESGWTVCRICGTVLNQGTTHTSRPRNEVDQLERLRRHFGGMI